MKRVLLLLVFFLLVVKVSYPLPSDSAINQTINPSYRESSYFSDSLGSDGINIFFEKDNKDVVGNILPWLIALLIGLISAIVNWKVSQRQIKNSKEIVKVEINASNIANKRQDWINTLRDYISELISLRLSLTYKIKDEKFGDVKFYELPEFIKLLTIVTKIDLLLNLKEPDSLFLIQNIRKFTMVTNNDFTELGFDTSIILDITKKILKNEWERIKKPE